MLKTFGASQLCVPCVALITLMQEYGQHRQLPAGNTAIPEHVVSVWYLQYQVRFASLEKGSRSRRGIGWLRWDQTDAASILG